MRIKVTFEELEKAQKECKKQTVISCAIGFIAIIIFFISFITGYVYINMAAIVLFLILCLLPNSQMKRLKNAKENYRKFYKSYFVEQSLSQIYTNISYNHAEGIPKASLEETDLVNLGYGYKSNDFVSGSYKQVNFSQADVEISSSSADYDVDLFLGRWMIFEFPKNFLFKMQITQKTFGPVAKGFPKRPDGAQIGKQIITESPTFNEKFNVFAEDEFEAFYLLDPVLIDRIEKISEKCKGKLMICFVDNKLHIAINNQKDTFEPPKPFKPINKNIESSKIYQETKIISELIEYLNLNQKIFK